MPSYETMLRQRDREFERLDAAQEARRKARTARELAMDELLAMAYESEQRALAQRTVEMRDVVREPLRPSESAPVSAKTGAQPRLRLEGDGLVGVKRWKARSRRYDGETARERLRDGLFVPLEVA